MTKLRNGTWVLVADGEKALFLENQTVGHDPFLRVVMKEEQDNSPNRDQKANRTGRMPDPGPGQRSAVDDTDWHELNKERFAADLAEMLYERAHAGRFDHLVLVAAPNILGALRDQVHPVVRDKIIGELPKTLTNHPLDEIEQIVKNDLAG